MQRQQDVSPAAGPKGPSFAGPNGSSMDRQEGGAWLLRGLTANRRLPGCFRVTEQWNYLPYREGPTSQLTYADPTACVGTRPPKMPPEQMRSGLCTRIRKIHSWYLRYSTWPVQICWDVSPEVCCSGESISHQSGRCSEAERSRETRALLFSCHTAPCLHPSEKTRQKTKQALTGASQVSARSPKTWPQLSRVSSARAGLAAPVSSAVPHPAGSLLVPLGQHSQGSCH